MFRKEQNFFHFPIEMLTSFQYSLKNRSLSKSSSFAISGVFSSSSSICWLSHSISFWLCWMHRHIKVVHLQTRSSLLRVRAWLLSSLQLRHLFHFGFPPSILSALDLTSFVVTVCFKQSFHDGSWWDSISPLFPYMWHWKSFRSLDPCLNTTCKWTFLLAPPSFYQV